MATTFASWKRRVSQLEKETYSLYLAYKDPRVPWYAKLLIVCIVAYPFSPLDKLLDSIPFIGYMDHLILVPIVVALIFKKMIPEAVLTDCREKTDTIIAKNKLKRWVLTLSIVGTWFLFAPLAVLFTAKIIKDWNLVVRWWFGWFNQTLK